MRCGGYFEKAQTDEVRHVRKGDVADSVVEVAVLLTRIVRGLP